MSISAISPVSSPASFTPAPQASATGGQFQQALSATAQAQSSNAASNTASTAQSAPAAKPHHGHHHHGGGKQRHVLVSGFDAAFHAFWPGQQPGGHLGLTPKVS